MRDRLIDFSRIDYLLVICVFFLLTVGAAIVFSASSFKAEQADLPSSYYLVKHVIRVGIGLALMFLFASIDYKVWLGFAPVFYGIGIVLLLLLYTKLPIVVQSGVTSHRWLQIGPFTFQPSDFARYGLILFLARALHQHRDQMEQLWHGYLKYVLYSLIVVGLIAFEKDFSTAALTMIIAFFIFLFAGVRLLYLAATFLTFLSISLIYIRATPYQLERVIDFIKQFLTGKVEYQLLQSKIALAVGGLLGQGIGNSRQKYLFLPESYKDFAYSILAEEAGFIGAAVILALFFVIIYRGMRLAMTAPDGYGRLLAAGITACIGVYAYTNAAVAMGLIPTTGIPMPFISYGGSAVISHLVGIGLLINISSQCDESRMNYSTWKTYQDRLHRKEPQRTVAMASPKRSNNLLKNKRISKTWHR